MFHSSCEIIFHPLKIFDADTDSDLNQSQPVNNRNTRAWCEICSKLTIKTPDRRQQRCHGVFVVNFEHISHLVLEFLLLALSRKMPAGYTKHQFSAVLPANLLSFIICKTTCFIFPDNSCNIRCIVHNYTKPGI